MWKLKKPVKGEPTGYLIQHSETAAEWLAFLVIDGDYKERLIMKGTYRDHLEMDAAREVTRLHRQWELARGNQDEQIVTLFGKP